MQPRRNHPLDRTGSSASIDPPTPSRSRSNSVELPKPRSFSNENNRLFPQPTASRSEMIRAPNSPPLSIGSNSPAHSNSSASNRINSLDQSLNSNLPSLNLSFFDNESTDLLNLTKNLGANIAKEIYAEKKDIPEIVKTTENITRASQYLESSLFDHDDDDFEDFPPPPQHASNVETQLRAELEVSNSKLGALQLNFNKIKVRGLIFAGMERYLFVFNRKQAEKHWKNSVEPKKSLKKRYNYANNKNTPLNNYSINSTSPINPINSHDPSYHPLQERKLNVWLVCVLNWIKLVMN
jgi:hypothetical protein